jgi:hypothetical protein
MPPEDRPWPWEEWGNLQALLIPFRFAIRHNQRERETHRWLQSWKRGAAPLAADKAFQWN